MGVKELWMRPLISVKESDRLLDAYLLMKQNNIRHLPVYDDSGEVTGILSDRDILRATTSSISLEKGFIFENLVIDRNIFVNDYMTTPVMSLPADIPEKIIAKKMIEYKISSFLLTEKNDVVGIVTSEDLLKCLVEVLEEREGEEKIYEQQKRFNQIQVEDL